MGSKKTNKTNASLLILLIVSLCLNGYFLVEKVFGENKFTSLFGNNKYSGVWVNGDEALHILADNTVLSLNRQKTEFVIAFNW